MESYKAVLRIPGVVVVLLIGFLARIPFSTIGILFTLHTVLTLERTYFEAGLVVTASTLGTAVASPLRGRLLDRHGLRATVLPSVIIQPLMIALAAFAPFTMVLVLALVSGLFAMPIFSIVRTSLSVLVPAHDRRGAFALDSIVTELVFMLGPAAVTIAAVASGTRPAIVVVALLVLLAGIGIMVANPPTRSDQITLPTHLPKPLKAAENAILATGEVHHEARVAENLATGQIPAIDPDTGKPVVDLHKPKIGTYLLTVGGVAILAATLVASMVITATDLTIVAFLEQSGKTTAIAWVLAVWCVGSLVGGLAYGATRRAISPYAVLLALGVLTVPIAVAQSAATLALTVLLAGLALAPIITATGESLSHRVPEEVRGEAMGWHGSALTTGTALGSPLVGIIIDQAGPRVGILSAALLAIGLALVGFLLQALRARRVRRRLG